MTLSSKPGSRRCPFATITGLSVPSGARGTSISYCQGRAFGCRYSVPAPAISRSMCQRSTSLSSQSATGTLESDEVRTLACMTRSSHCSYSLGRPNGVPYDPECAEQEPQASSS